MNPMRWRFPWLACAWLVSLLAAGSAGAQTLEELRSRYDYDRSRPFDVRVVGEEEQRLGFKRTHLFYKGAYDEEVPAFLYLPTEVKKRYAKEGPPWPCIFFMHFHVSDKTLAEVAAIRWAKKGFCVFAIDGIFRGERAVEGKDILDPDPRATVRNMKHQITDILRGLDLLATLPEVDKDRIGYFGISMGAITGTVAVALSPQVRAAVLADAGGNLPTFFQNSSYKSVQKSMQYIEQSQIKTEELLEMLKDVDPIYYGKHIAPRPVLMLNGKEDDIVPVPNIQELYESLGEPKQIIWYDSDHYLPIPQVLVDTSRFFEEVFYGGPAD